MADFSLQIKNFGDKTAKVLADAVRMASLELAGRVIERTPHDTGRARANWQIAIDGEPPESSVWKEKYDEAGTEARAAIAEALARMPKEARRIILQNNLVYIMPLEYGHSRQAPQGMVRLSVAEFPEIMVRICAGGK